jgi:hypothetical protein
MSELVEDLRKGEKTEDDVTLFVILTTALGCFAIL